MKNSKLKFSEYMQNISRSKSFGKFVLIVKLNSSQGYTVLIYTVEQTIRSRPQLSHYLYVRSTHTSVNVCSTCTDWTHQAYQHTIAMRYFLTFFKIVVSLDIHSVDSTVDLHILISGPAEQCQIKWGHVFGTFGHPIFWGN